MSAFLTPEKKPFFARMYFSPQVFAGLLEFSDAVTEQIRAVFLYPDGDGYRKFCDLMCISGIVQRTDTSGKQIDCDGFMIHIFDSSDEHIMVDMFTAAVGYE